MSWTIAARNTIAANANLIVNMIPLFMPLAVFALTREIPKRFEIAGTAVALVGFAVLSVPSFRGTSETLPGDALAFGSMLFLATYLALARRNRGPGSVWIYVMPLYLVAGLLCVLTSLFFTSPAEQSYSPINILTLGGIILGPTVIGHSAINQAMARLPVQLVGLSQLSQTIWAGLMGLLVFGEVPHPLFAVAAACITGGVIIIIVGHAGRRPSSTGTRQDS
jgi:drug/metabolite transporter (DMT)-like permease